METKPPPSALLTSYHQSWSQAQQQMCSGGGRPSYPSGSICEPNLETGRATGIEGYALHFSDTVLTFARAMQSIYRSKGADPDALYRAILDLPDSDGITGTIRLDPSGDRLRALELKNLRVTGTLQPSCVRSSETSSSGSGRRSLGIPLASITADFVTSGATDLTGALVVHAGGNDPIRFSGGIAKVPSDSPPRVVPEVRIGALFPVFSAGHGFVTDLAGVKRLESFLLALRKINDKHDGISDDLLPNTQLKFAFRDSRRDASAAFNGAVDLMREAFGGRGVSAIVGAASSDSTISAAIATSQSAIPQISYSATSTELSDGHTYPYFARVPPSDAFQSVAHVDVLKSLFGYTTIATVYSDHDTYSNSMHLNFYRQAEADGVTVLASIIIPQNVDPGSQELHNAITQLRFSLARVVVIFAQAKYAGRFLKSAFEHGVGGPGFLWLGSDAVTKADSTPPPLHVCPGAALARREWSRCLHTAHKHRTCELDYM